ncbi:MAG: hypothetical protein QNJ31_04215 [Candidatus Caenarcaniphilales bacterium]|nr:hypothetical protein [Candidatus Caenarcaniphilales bacterium]
MSIKLSFSSKLFFNIFAAVVLLNSAAVYSFEKKNIYKSKDLEVSQSQINTTNKILEDNFKLYKIHFKNKSDKDYKLEGIIFNQVTTQEAEAKFKQLEYEQKEKRKKVAIVGAVSFIGSTAIGAIFSPGLILWSILQKATTSTIIGKADSYFREKTNSQFIRKVDSSVSAESFYQFDLDSKSSKDLYYLLPLSKNIKGVFAFQVKTNDTNNQKTQIISRNIDSHLVKTIFENPSKDLFQSAYVDYKFLEKRQSGVYISRRGFPLKKLETSEVESIDKTKSNKQLIQIKNAPSKKINLRKSQIFIYQNLFRSPKRYQLTLHKINKSPNKTSTYIEGSFVKFALKEIKPGLMQLQSPKKNKLILEFGDYALIYKKDNTEISVYDFTVR